MSNSATKPPVRRAPAGLTTTLRFRLLSALSIATLIELSSRILHGMGWGDELLGGALSGTAVALACGAIAVLVSRTSGTRYVHAFMVLAAGALAASLALRISAAVPALAQIPILGLDGAFHDVTAGVTDLIGITAWVFGFFWMVFELQQTHDNLDAQRHLLLAEIEERRHAETVLRESEGRFRAVFDHVAAGIMTMTPQGRIIECNQAVGAELGYSLRQLNGTVLDTLIHDDDQAAYREALGALHSSEKFPHTFEARLVCRDESVVRFRITATLIRPDTRQAGTVVALLENITERRIREKQLQQHQKMESLGVLAGGVAHDFNNLLVGMMANAELLSRALESNPEQVQTCMDMVHSAQRAADLCHQLLVYAGRAPRSEQALNLTELVEGSQQLLRMSLSREASLEFRCAPALPSISADPIQISQALLSLIRNASDALHGEPGHITIATGTAVLTETDFAGLVYRHTPEPGEYVFLEVADTGEGMSEEAISRVFDPFYTTKHQGSGLGLAAVLGIVHAHRGMLSLRSTPGEGATFRIYFLRTEHEAEPIQAESATPARPAEGALVLLVDDEALVRGAARRILEHSGYRVICAVDGLEGVELFELHHTRLAAVLLDLTMPRMNGETACKKMREIDPGVPIILSSGYNANESSEPAIFSQVAGYLRKPYRIKQLLDILNRVT